MATNPTLFDRLFASWRGEQDAAEPANESERLQIATSVILLETAGIDNEFTPAECQRIIETLKSRFGVSQTDAEELIVAAEKERADASGIWKFTNRINQACTTEEKRRIIEEVWRVIYADTTLDGHEDYLVHKLARLLNLDHRDLIDAKVKVLAESRGA